MEIVCTGRYAAVAACSKILALLTNALDQLTANICAGTASLGAPDIEPCRCSVKLEAAQTLLNMYLMFAQMYLTTYFLVNYFLYFILPLLLEF